MSKQLKSASLLGLVCALAGCIYFASPWGESAEASTGLHWLFLTRGPSQPPKDVAIIAITKAASQRLGLPYRTDQWPRGLHAELIDRLNAAGARTIVFDLLFRESRGADDLLLGEAMQQGGNVLLLEFLDKELLDPAGMATTVHRRLPPTDKIAEAAAATAPFTLPKRPLQVAQFWTFDENAGTASLPLLTLLAHAQPPAAWLALLDDDTAAIRTIPGDRRPPRLADLAEKFATALRDDATLADRLLQTSRATGPSDTRIAQQKGLLSALASPNSRHLNFYGPPWTIRTLHYDRALEMLRRGDKASGDATFWKDRAVFVGLSSPVQWQQADEFITPFSDADTGLDISGIEILATAYANLLNRSTLNPLSPAASLGLLAAWGLLIGMSASLVPPLWSASGISALSALYYAVASALFATQHHWLPVISPILVQGGVALIGGLMLHYYRANRDRQRIRELFGYYLPDVVVDRLVRQGFHPREDRETVFGVCLYSDAEAYSTLSERLSPADLASYMDAYYEVIFEPVRRRGGTVSDVVGDAMMAIWAAREDDREIRIQACLAALEIQQTLSLHGAGTEIPLLNTRFGIHCGAMTLAHVGAQDHFEYRAVGDIVNTASRLEELNKKLGTTIVVSTDVVAGIEPAAVRPLGNTSLPGKRSPIEVVELTGWRDDASTTDNASSSSAM